MRDSIDEDREMRAEETKKSVETGPVDTRERRREWDAVGARACPSPFVPPFFGARARRSHTRSSTPRVAEKRIPPVPLRN